MKACLVGAVLALAASCASTPVLPPAEQRDSITVIDRGGWISMRSPAVPARATGLVFYPGGFVDPSAYLAVLEPIAAAGYAVDIVRMPAKLAFFGTKLCFAVMEAETGIDRWVIAGHSLGGVAAAIALHGRPAAFAGIAFWASYPPASADLSGFDLPALSISASLDGLSTPAKVAAAAALLPSGSQTLLIEGGNHGQFGTYGPQRGDGKATIDAVEQQNDIASAMLGFLASVEARGH